MFFRILNSHELGTRFATGFDGKLRILADKKTYELGI